ncbi:tryptophan 2,3-dioxygenase [Rhopalosiphum maidis]|uniref:tryptophan 2,3-dioxygenase n=1 Tax=Rhopalosiphum maidis TaxID=43146 RepID=UPI000F00FC40|nr:tryptophan 2,3-dioxygenase [Rhopalosiphum maidis]
MSCINGKDRVNDHQNNKRCKQNVSASNSYADYLQLDKLLDSQTMLSMQNGRVSYDEHLFIVTHQAYELWFKQILFEMDIVCKLLSGNLWNNEQEMFNIVKRLGRISSIIKLLLEHFGVLETMTPYDFAEFRDYLKPASGFQSLQFRMIENKLGLKKENRVNCCKSYTDCFNGKKYDELERVSAEPSLFSLVCHWLESIPMLKDNIVWDQYRRAADHWLERSTESDISCLEKQRKLMDTVFKCDQHKRLVDQGNRKFSHMALKGAILVYAYRYEKECTLANKILESLVDIDTLLSKWRYSHFVMVHKMIGSYSSGTGGTTGSEYLKSTLCDSYRIFIDLVNLPALIVPAMYVPPLIKSQGK